MNTPKPNWLARTRLGITSTLTVVISVFLVLNLSAASPPQDAEKKVTVSGVDSTRIDYEQGFAGGTDKGIFHPDPANDDRDLATGSKIKTIKIVDAKGAPFPGGEKDCASQNCTVDIQTNRGRVRVADLGNNIVLLEYGERQRYRYACPQGKCGAYSKNVNVLNVTLDTRKFSCAGGRCSAEVTYTVR